MSNRRDTEYDAALTRIIREGDEKGLTDQAIVDALNDQGALTRNGRPWSLANIRRVRISLGLQRYTVYPGAKNTLKGVTL